MNARLEMLIQMVSLDGKGLIDVGTDHAMLPISLAQRGYQGNLYASDLHDAPLQRAVAAAVQDGLIGRIEFLKCDGLDACPPDAIDTIVIAGLGGDTICGILDRAEWVFESDYTLILQPMQKMEIVRYWLVHNGFLIDREELIKENGHLFQMFRSRPGISESYSDAEYLLGRLSQVKDTALAMEQAEREEGLLRKKTDALSQIPTSPDESAARSFYLHILQELEEYRNGLR